MQPQPHHSETDVRLFQRRPVVGAVTGDGHHLTICRNARLDHALDQRVLVGGRRAGQHAQSGPDLVQKFLLHVALFVTNTRVELSAVQNQEVVVGLQK